MSATKNPSTPKLTRPAIVKMDAILGKQFPLLDNGFVRVVDYMGGDEAIVQAARVSYGSGTKTLRQDEGLIRYLLRHNHTTPFEMCEVKLHVKIPIFVARQWIRHRTANVNEYSARYSVLDEEFYVPEPQNIQAQSATNKQGRGEPMQMAEAKQYAAQIRRVSKDAYAQYQQLLQQKMARELARMVLPTNFYTQWFWKIDLHNLLRFLSLRAHPHAQYEIRVYAEKILQEILPRWVPLTARAFSDYQLGATTLSRGATKVVRQRLGGNKDYTDQTMSPRETEELNRFFQGKDTES